MVLCHVIDNLLFFVYVQIVGVRLVFGVLPSGSSSLGKMLDLSLPVSHVFIGGRVLGCGDSLLRVVIAPQSTKRLLFSIDFIRFSLSLASFLLIDIAYLCLIRALRSIQDLRQLVQLNLSIVAFS
jgi:hypothetical protein